MMRLHKTLASGLLVVGLGVLSASAFAQGHSDSRHYHDRPEMTAEQKAKFAQEKVRRATALHDKLKITPEQEAAWKTYLTATQGKLGDREAPLSKEAMSKLNAPQRMEHQLNGMKSHLTHFEARVAATKTFYATLSPEQQKVFDAETARSHKRGDKKHHKDQNKDAKPAK
jgi:protein CpxP